MSAALTYSLAAAIGLLTLCGGLLAAWRLIPRPEPTPDLQEAWAAIHANRLAILDLTDKYETAVQRDRGRQRKPKAEPVEAPMLDNKAALRAAARAAYPHLVGGGD